MVTIEKVESKRDLKKFIAFPFQLYAGNRYWIPPLTFDEMNTLRRDKNPAFESCDANYWLAFKDGKIVGRIAGIVNRRYAELWGKKYVRFGWIDFVDDEEVSKALLDTIEQWAKRQGMEAIHGPLGFTDLDREGMLIQGFDELGTLATIYNHPYYPEHLEKLGYTKDADWVEFKMVPSSIIPEKVERIAKVVAERYQLRTLRIKKAKELLPYANQIFEVLNSSYANLYGFVPLSQRQIDMYVKQYFSFILPEHVPVVLDRNDKVVAFGITMPSLSKALQKANGSLFPFGFMHILKAMKNNHWMDLYLTAVRPDMQDKGVNAILIYEVNILCAKKKINHVESNPELETNTKVQAQWRFYEGTQHKRRRCFIKHLSPATL